MKIGENTFKGENLILITFVVWLSAVFCKNTKIELNYDDAGRAREQIVSHPIFPFLDKVLG